MNRHLCKLSAKKLFAHTAKCSHDHKQSIDAMIANGYGYATGNQIREFATGSSLLSRTILAKRWVETAAAERAAFDEEDARKRHHGSLKPIKNV